MSRTQAVFLGHCIPMAITFWLWCWYYSEKRKKVRQCANTKRTRENYLNSNYTKLEEEKK